MPEHRFARCLLEARLVDERREIVLIRQRQGGVVLVDPRDGELERAPRVEAGGARVGVRGRFGVGRRLVDRRPFALEKGEMAHVTVHSGPGAVSGPVVEIALSLTSTADRIFA